MQELMLIGNLGQDCSVIQHEEIHIINFSVCRNDKWKDKNGIEHSRQEWFDISWFVKKPTIAPYLLKGTQVFIKGTVSAKAYINKDGTLSASLNVKVHTLQLLGAAKVSENIVNDSNSIQYSSDDLPY